MLAMSATPAVEDRRIRRLSATSVPPPMAMPISAAARAGDPWLVLALAVIRFDLLRRWTPRGKDPAGRRHRGGGPWSRSWPCSSRGPMTPRGCPSGPDGG